MANQAEVQEGIQFRVNGSKISTTKSGKNIFASAIRSLDPNKAESIVKERNWRKNYVKHVAPITTMAISSSDNALHIAQSGLEAAYGEFEFYRNGKSVPLRRMMSTPIPNKYHTHVIAGKNKGNVPTISVPYRGTNLRGNTLAQQVSDWLDRNIIETSHAAALLDMIANQAWQDLSDQYFVLLGAGSEVGPLEYLLGQGANVIAIDLDCAANWQRLIKIARESSGTLYIPTRKQTDTSWSDDEIAKVSGANLLTATPEIADWLSTFDMPLTIGSYAYLDSGNHVRVVMAMDAIADRLIQQKRDINLAYLLTPTDVYAVCESSISISTARYKKFTLFKPVKSILRAISNGRLFAPNIRKIVKSVEGQTYGIVNSLVSRQGPNYVLAKRIQRWRALVARNAGIRVSCNVAPSTSTVSVVKNKVFAAGMAGSEIFGGEVFAPDTTNALMSLVLMHDVQSSSSYANPDLCLNNPEELFIHGANHGGMWRIPNQLSSVIEVGVLLGLAKQLIDKLRPTAA